MRVERVDREWLGLAVRVEVRGLQWSVTDFAPDTTSLDSIAEGLYQVLVQASMFHLPHVAIKVRGTGVPAAKAESVARILARDDIQDVFHRKRAEALAKSVLARKHNVPESQVHDGKAHKIDDSMDRRLQGIKETRAMKRVAEAAGEPWPQYLFAQLGRYSRAMREEEE